MRQTRVLEIYSEKVVYYKLKPNCASSSILPSLNKMSELETKIKGATLLVNKRIYRGKYSTILIPRMLIYSSIF